MKGNWQLDHNIQSKTVAMAFSMSAEIKRDLICLRAKVALRAKKAAGQPMYLPKGPSKSKLDPFRPKIEALLAKGRGNNKLSHLACLFAQLPRCGKGYIERLCATYHALNLYKNPAQSWENLLFPRP